MLRKKNMFKAGISTIYILLHKYHQSSESLQLYNNIV